MTSPPRKKCCSRQGPRALLQGRTPVQPASPAAGRQVFWQAPSCLPERLLCHSVIREQLRLRLGVQSKGVCPGQGLCTPRTGTPGDPQPCPQPMEREQEGGDSGQLALKQHASPAKATSGQVCDILCAAAGRAATLGSRQQGGRVASLTPAPLAVSPQSHLFTLLASVALFVKWRQQCRPSETTVRPHATRQGTWLRGHGSHWMLPGIGTR